MLCTVQHATVLHAHEILRDITLLAIVDKFDV